MKILDLKDSHRYNLQFDVDGQFVKRTDNNLPVAKCKNLFKAKFNFIGDEWTGTKTALFAQGEYSKSVVLDDNDECVIPWEFFDTDENMAIGKVSVSCGDLVTTNCATVKITKSGYQESDASVPPSPDVYQQLIELAEDTKKIAQSVRDDADAGKFDGEEGYSPKVLLTEELDGVTVTVQNKDGQQSAKVKNGKDGKDYEHSEEFTKLAEQVRQDKESVEQTVQGFEQTTQQAVENVNTAKTQGVDAINTAKEESAKAVVDKGTEQTGNVTAEGEKQVQAVQAKGQEVINSIPSDYTTQMATKLDKQQGTENAGKLLGVGTDGNVALMGGASVGEILIADYTHQGNPEFHFSDFDFTTGIGTTTEPHGLTKKTEVLMCPNGWTILNPFNGMLSMPIEWTMVEKLSDALALIPVDNTHLKVVASKEEAIINVNLEDVSNANVDITKFHFEKPISYVIKNLDYKINTKYVKVLSSGYCFYLGRYRYRNVFVIFESGNINTVNYINTLGFSRGGNTPARNGVFVNEETLIDLRNNTKYYNKILSYARRKGYSHLINDPARAVDDAWISSQGANVKAIKSYSTYSDSYAYMSNGTRIQIYALEGEYKNES